MTRTHTATMILAAAVALPAAQPANADDDRGRRRDRDDDRRPRVTARHDRDHHNRRESDRPPRPRDRHHRDRAHHSRHHDTRFRLHIDSDRGISISAGRAGHHHRSYYNPYRYRTHRYDHYRPRHYSHYPLRHRSYPHTYRCAPRPVVVHRPPVHAHRVDAWGLLTDGRAAAARNAFANRVNHHPHRGEPKVGLALAHALLCEDARAAQIMRRALIHDSAALQRIPLNPRLRHRLANESHRLERKAYTRAGSTDDLILAASMQHILGHHHNAATLVHRAIDAGDRQHSTIALKLLVKRHSSTVTIHHR